MWRSMPTQKLNEGRMITTGQIWVFYNRLSKKKSKPMTLVQAQMIVLGLKSSQTPKFFIWTPGWTEWQRLDAFLKVNQSFFAVAPTKISQKSKSSTTGTVSTTSTDIEIPEGGTLVTQIEETEKTEFSVDYNQFDFHGDHLNLDKKVPPPKANPLSEKRTSVRYAAALDVILVTKSGKSFRTISLNISMTGILLEAPIPKEFFGGVFDLIIGNRMESDPKKTRFLFRGRLVGDLTDPKRLTFVEPTKETASQLQALLQSLESYQEESAAKSLTKSVDKSSTKSPAKAKAG